MKLVFTIHDAGVALNVGGSVESISSVLEIDEGTLPASVRRYMDMTRSGERHYMSLSISLVHPSDEKE